MGAVESIEHRYCLAPKKNGQPCKAPAGRNTPHPGVGPCSNHGGNLPNVIKHHAEATAVDMARTFGYTEDVDPFTAILGTVSMSYGTAKVFARRLRDLGEDVEATHPDVIGFMAATKNSAQIAKMAIDAGIAEREVRIMERLSDSIAQAFEDAVVDMAPDDRQALAERFSRALERREAGVIEGTETGET